MPANAVVNLVQDKLARSKGVESLKNNGCGHGADEALPHCLIWEVIRQSLGIVSIECIYQSERN